MRSPRRLLAVLFGSLAMATSLATIGVIVVSDIAEARDTADTLSDELPVYEVKQSPRLVPQEPELELPPFDDLTRKELSGRPRGKRLPFGAFEGY